MTDSNTGESARLNPRENGSSSRFVKLFIAVAGIIIFTSGNLYWSSFVGRQRYMPEALPIVTLNPVVNESQPPNTSAIDASQDSNSTLDDGLNVSSEASQAKSTVVSQPPNTSATEASQDSNSTLDEGLNVSSEASQLKSTDDVSQPPNTSATEASDDILAGVLYARNVSWDYDKWFLADGRPRYTITEDRSLHENYYQLAIEGYFVNKSMKLAPIELMQEYIRMHGREQLDLEWEYCQNNSEPHRLGNLTRILQSPACAALAQRKFVVGRYACPLEAGNRLHSYMNHLLWAIVTNRTFLSRYWDFDYCMTEYRELELPPDYCGRATNKQSDCDPILQVKDWVPDFHHWQEVFDFPSPIRADGITKKGYDKLGRPYDQEDSPRLIRCGDQKLTSTALYLAHHKYRRELLSKQANRKKAGALLSKGPYFLYGMFFECLFNMQPIPSQDIALMADPNIYQTWVLHSRHAGGQDGNYILPEVKCMESVVKRIKPPCIVYVMTDRAAALKTLPKMLRDYNCVGIFANHTGGRSFSAEHGVFAGLGFFQDLKLAWTARHGFMAPHTMRRKGMGIRTSSALVREGIEFRREVEGNPNWTQSMEVCTNPFYQFDFASKVKLPQR